MTDPRSRAAQQLDSLLRRFSEWAIPKLASGAGDPEYWQARVVEAQAALAVLAVPPAEPQEGEEGFVATIKARKRAREDSFNDAVDVLLAPPGKPGRDVLRNGHELAAEIERLRAECGLLRERLAVREPGPNVTEEGKLQGAIDRAYDAAMEFGDNPQQALVCVIEWLEPVVSEGPGEGTAR